MKAVFPALLFPALLLSQAVPAAATPPIRTSSDIKKIYPGELGRMIRERDEKKKAAAEKGPDGSEKITVPDFEIIDLRIEADYQKGAIPGALNIPLVKLRWLKSSMVPFETPLVVYGYSIQDKAAVNSVIILANKGYNDVSFLEGGWEAWQKSSLNSYSPKE